MQFSKFEEIFQDSAQLGGSITIPNILIGLLVIGTK